MQVAQGDLAGARAAYQEGLGITRALAKADRGSAEKHRDLGIFLGKIGDVQVAQGDLTGARAAYQEELAITRAGWRSPIPARSAGSAIFRSPSTRSATCRSRRAICRPRGPPIRQASPSGPPTKSDPSSASRQRDLSVSYDKIGDVQMAQGDLPAR